MKNLKELYSKKDLNIMLAAEKGRLPGKNRVEELISFAEKTGVKKIGIANCISLQKETNDSISRLNERFDVYSVDCKIGRVEGKEMLNDETVKGLSCNPSAQADYLAENKTELNVAFGLCVGNDIIFNSKSTAPVTTLLVKDRQHKHNPYKEFIKE